MFNSVLKYSAISIALSWATFAMAATVPKPSDFDKRIQYVMYNPDDVVIIKTADGASTLIQLEQDEYFTNIPTGGLSMGDTGAWKLGVRGNNLFMKPIGPFPETNINLVSNKRTYAFSLIDVGVAEKAAWQVRFRYPAEPVTMKQQSAKPVDNGPCSDGPKNLNWFKYGDMSLAPTEVWDDGRFTCMRFPTTKALPVPYRYTPENELKEALPDFHNKDDVLVIHEVSGEFRLRIGNKVLGMKTDSLRNAPYNFKKTSTGETRVIRNER